MKKVLKKNIFWSAVFSLLVIVCLAVILLQRFTKEKLCAEIYSEGKLIRTIDDLDPGKPYSFEVKTGLGTNTVRVEKGSVSVSGSDCKNKICVYHGKISKAGESIICAPHKLIIRITGSSGPDAVV